MQITLEKSAKLNGTEGIVKISPALDPSKRAGDGILSRLSYERR